MAIPLFDDRNACPSTGMHVVLSIFRAAVGLISRAAARYHWTETDEEMCMPSLQEIPARQGRAVRIERGHALQIINTFGTQVVDFWAFAAKNLDTYIDPR